MLRAPFNSFQHRADQSLEDSVSDVDEAAIAGSPLNFFDGAGLVNLSPTSPGGASGIKPVAPLQGASASSVNAQTAPPVTVADGASVEISGVSAQSVTFTGTTGTLKLDDSLAFTGQILGLAGSDAIDLADVSYGIQTQVTFLGNTTGGTLTITDGVHTANIALQGDYLSSTWTLSSDGNGGTVVVDPAASSNWQTLKVGAGGFIRNLDIAPDGTMVGRTDTYGAYLWNGSKWVQLVTSTSMPAAFVAANVDSGNTGQGVYEIQIADSNTQIFYMMYDGYVFKSTNQGTTWTQTSFAQVNPNTSANPNDGFANYGQKMAIDPNNPNIVYVGTELNGLFVTTNGGTTWSSVSQVPASVVSSGSSPGITGILFDPAIGGVVNGVTQTIFAESNGNGVYESTNGGASWAKLSGGPTTVTNAAVSSTGVYYATDGTNLWIFANGKWTEPAVAMNGMGIQAIAVNPSNPNEIVLVSPAGYLDVSYNAGATWSGVDWDSNAVNSTDIPWLKAANEASSGNFLDIGGVVFNPLVPNQIIASAGTGVWNASVPTSNPTSITWNDQSLGIEQLVANEIIVPPGGNPVVASWDRPFFYISNLNAYPSTYGPVDSVNINAGWSVDYASSDPSFIAGLIGYGAAVYSTNGGQTWQNFASEPTFPGQANGGTIAASTPENIIDAPADGVQPYYTLNGGVTWNPITLPGVTSWSNFEGAYYLDERSITADRVLANTFYLYYPGQGVYETTNGGVSWTQVYSGNDGYGSTWNGYITPFDWYNNELMSVPGEAGNLFFTGGQQGTAQPDTQEPFMRSTNGGATWTAVPNVLEVTCFGFGKAAPGQSYPAIYIVGWVNNVYGIWQSINNAQSWTQIGTYPNSSLDTIKTISGDPNIYGQVYVGFQGSGYAVLEASPVQRSLLVTSVATESPSTGDLNAGKTVTLTLNLSEVVTVAGGTPTLTLNDGGTATYTGGSGTSALTFSYTVGAGQNTASLAATTVNLNDATIQDGSGNAASFSLSGVTQTGPQIDTTTPSVSSVVTSGTGITSGSGDLGVGSVVTLTVNLSEAVTVAGGTPTLTLNDGGTATYTGGSGTSALTFSYTVATGQSTSDLAVSAFNSNSATIKNGAGTAASLTGAVTNPAGTLQIDTTTPSVSSVVTSGTGITSGSGDLGVGSVVTLTVNLSEAVTVAGGTPTLTLNDGGKATYTGGSGTSALTFSYTVAAGQSTADLTVTAFNSNSATIKNGAGTAASLAGAVTNPAGTLQIDTTIPTVTQVVASPGSGTENPGAVITLTVDLSEAVTVTGKPTLTLNDGAIATYVSGSGTNALTFSYTVAATNSTVPTLAITQVNLPGGATVKDAAGNAANLSGAVTTFPGLSIDPPPVVVSVTETPSTGDLNAGKTVTLTLSLNDVVTVTGGTPTLTLNDGGTATYTGGSGTNALTFSYTVGAGQNTASLAATGLTLNGATVQNSLGNAAIFSFSGVTQTGPQIDTATPTVTSVAASGSGITAGTGDVPAGSVVTLTLNLSEAVTVTGGTPTLTLNDGGTATYTGGSGTNALTFSYTVAGGQGTADLAVTAVNLGTATVKDGAGNVANLSGAVTNPAGTLQIDGVTSHIAQVGSDFFLDNIKGSGPELKQGGAVVTAGGITPWTPIAAVQVAGGGYDVAWHNTSSGLYSVWSVDSNGNYLSNLLMPVAGNSPALENFETIFNQDLNGDGTIGLTKVVIQTDGTTALTEVGNDYFLNPTSGGTGPELKQGGVVVTAGEFGTWTPIGAVQVAGGGYDIAWHNTSSGQYSVWSLDSNGNYLSNLINPVAGNTTTLENFETIFNQDLNGDGTTGLTKVVIQTDGATALTEVGNNYFLNPTGGGTGPELKQGGVVVTAGEFGTWTPIGAVQVAGGGYDIAWHDTGSGLYSVWSLDSNGNYLSNLLMPVAGNTAALENFETIFNQDLNGDGTIGLPTVVIQTDGSTALTQVGNDYFLNPTGGGTGPELKQGGAVVTAGEFGTWTPIGAVQVAGGGYDIAWHNTSSGQYSVWSLDSNGNYLSNVINPVAGNSPALETLENTFQQDLNGDGVIGIYATPGTTLQISNPLSGPSGSATIGAGATLELAAANSSSVTFTSSTGSLELDQPSTFDGVIFGFTGNGTLSGSDQIDLKGISFSNIHDSYSNGVLTVSNGTQSAELDFNGSYVLANFEFASDGKGGTIVYDPPVTGQASNAAANTTNNPAVSALNQQVALFTQQIAAAFPSSSAGDASSPTGSASELTAAQLTQLTTPVANQQHA